MLKMENTSDYKLGHFVQINSGMSINFPEWETNEQHSTYLWQMLQYSDLRCYFLRVIVNC